MSYGGCVLDRQQIESVVACEDAQLVLASAGSGKTLSLLAKIEYLHYQLHIPAAQILAISFTQKTVSELKGRCNVKNVEIRTFHSLGNSIMNFINDQSFLSKKLIEKEKTDLFVRSYCEFLILHDAEFAKNVVDFVLFFFSAPQNPSHQRTFAAKISFNRLYLRRAFHMQPNDHIRMKDEQLIANWLYIHNLKYTHNQQYPHIDIKYKPTFTIKSPQEIYLDCVDLDQNGKSHRGGSYLKDLK